jgi:hypothetical protein
MSQKVLNALATRIARLESLAEDKDAFPSAGGVTYGGLQFEGSTFNIGTLDEQLSENNGFDANANTIFDLQQRISELELLISGGSNDTNQGGALDAGQGVGDDASEGTGEPIAPPPTTPDTLGLGTMAYQDSNAVAITGGSITGITDLAVADGGTGASTAANARTNLGIGTIATQDSNNVSITGGSITGITDLAIADGGTGSSTASGARTNLGLGTMATQDASNVAITGGFADFTANEGSVALRVRDSSNSAQLEFLPTADGGSIYFYDEAGAANMIMGVQSDNSVQMSSSYGIDIGGAGGLRVQMSSGATLGFFTSYGTTKPTVTGSRGGNAALASLLTALADLGLLTNSSSA